MNHKNQTALHFAARYGPPDIGEALLSNGADPDVTDIRYQKRTILYWIKKI